MKQNTVALSLVGLLLSACSSAPPQPQQFYRLATEAPPAAEAATAQQNAAVWQLLPVQLPDYLQRDRLWLPIGDTGLQPLEGQLWAEPLREALPRVLRHDLALLRGADRIWSGPLPAGLQIERQLRIELLALEATPDRRAVRLQARWALIDPLGRSPLRLGEADLQAPSAGPAPEQLVAAHRLALWLLARQIAAQEARSAAMGAIAAPAPRL